MPALTANGVNVGEKGAILTPELAEVITAWTALPDYIKKTIKTLIPEPQCLLGGAQEQDERSCCHAEGDPCPGGSG
jgi:hypothetical protein